METDSNIPMSSLSAGVILRELLLMDEDISRMVYGKVFPVAGTSAELPYIVYRRVSLEQTPDKSRPYNDEIGVEMVCCTANYGTGIELAERARAALDGCSATHGPLRMRSCILVDSDEDWENDAYLQRLVFAVRIGAGHDRK